MTKSLIEHLKFALHSRHAQKLVGVCVRHIMGASCNELILGRCRVFNHASIQTRRIVDAGDKSGKTERWYARDPRRVTALRRPTARANLSLRGPPAAVAMSGDLRRAEVECACFGRSHCAYTAVRGAPMEAAVSAVPTI